MSDTPRTDAEPWINRYPEYHDGATQYVKADFARTLERELAEARAEIERLSVAIQAATVLIAAKGRHNTFIAYNGLRAALAAVKAQSPPRCSICNGTGWLAVGYPEQNISPSRCTECAAALIIPQPEKATRF